MNSLEQHLDQPELSVFDVPSVPFFVFHIAQGDYTKKAEGIIRLERQQLVLEYKPHIGSTKQTLEWVGGMLSYVFGGKEYTPKPDATIVQLEIPLTDVEELYWKTGWYFPSEGSFRNALFLRVKRLSLLANMPGSTAGSLLMILPRKHKQAAQALASRAMLIKSELFLKSI